MLYYKGIFSLFVIASKQPVYYQSVLDSFQCMFSQTTSRNRLNSATTEININIILAHTCYRIWLRKISNLRHATKSNLRAKSCFKLTSLFPPTDIISLNDLLIRLQGEASVLECYSKYVLISDSITFTKHGLRCRAPRWLKMGPRTAPIVTYRDGPFDFLGEGGGRRMIAVQRIFL